MTRPPAGRDGHPEGRSADGLRQQLGLFDATMIVCGSVIGIGIFTTTGFVAAELPQPGLLLAAWALGGAISLAGALTNAELGATLPRAGGDYVYLREAFHPLLGFFAGWLTFGVVFCGTLATLAAGFVEYLAVFVPSLASRGGLVLGPVRLDAGTGAALLAVWGCTALSVWGVRESTRFQNGMSLLKIAAIVGLCVAGPLFGTGDWSRLSAGPADPLPARLPADVGAVPVVAFGLALVPILFTYLGWNAPVYIASELRRPARTLPRALLLGTVIVTGVYLLLNAVYLYALPVEQMFHVGADGGAEGVVRIAELAARALFGSSGAVAIAALVLVSIVGALNASVIVGARIVYAMALDRNMPGVLAAVHPTRGTPHVALWAQAGVASLLLVTGTFGQLLTYTTFAVITLMVLDGLALFRLRSRADLPHPYRLPGYPWVPALYVAAAVGLWGNTLLSYPTESLLGLGIAASAAPAYWWARRGGAGRTVPPA